MTARQILILLLFTALGFHSNTAQAQGKGQYLRIARIVVDSVKLEEYTAALKEQMTAALKFESGVLAYAAVQDKNDPTRITIFETYASLQAYEAHIQTDHFKKYKATVEKMVLSLELTDVTEIVSLHKSRL